MATPNSGLDVFLAGNTAQNVADFKIKGDFGGSCYFYLGDCHTMIATASVLHLLDIGPHFSHLTQI